MSVPDREPAAPDPPLELLDLAAERLLAVSPDARAAVLQDLVQEQPAFATALRRLADDLAGAERLLQQTAEPATEAPAAIGPYRVLDAIGEGAFGVVYRCLQEVPVRREVAVKVLRPGAGDRHTLARFEAERHLLATLSHASIAQVFDAGTLPDGRPYFVMEHVRGLPITSYCDRHRLGVEARVSLFVRLCHGAHHAHERGIVHRDLKPANVLVFEQDGQPQPKIIDFGIAKALHQGDQPAGFRTETGRVIGTPGYMSPEQAMGKSRDLDARADVFALGAMLYELLTGVLPWGRRPESTDSTPLRPSARIATDATDAVARQRSVPPHKLASRLRGDLDWIVLKALAREPERRYASAQELAADLVRHLDGVPVLAGPPALGYRLRKFARRHRVLVWATGAVLAVTAVGLWMVLSFREQAELSMADAEAAAASLLARAGDKRLAAAPRSDGLVKALLQDALELYERLLRARPTEPRLREPRARALVTLARVHWLVGEPTKAAGVAQEAAAEATALIATDPEHLAWRGLLAEAECNRGRALAGAGQVELARASFDRAVAELDRCHAAAPGAFGRQLVGALLDQANARSADELDECARGLRRAVAIQEERLRAEPSLGGKLDLMDVLTALANTLNSNGRTSQAARVFLRAEELLGSTPDADPVHVCRVLRAGARVASVQGEHEVAIQRWTRAAAAARRWSEQEPTWREPRRELLDVHQELALQQSIAGHAGAAAETGRAGVAVGEAWIKAFPHDSLAPGRLADLLSQCASVLVATGRRGDLAEAEDCARRALRMHDTLPASLDARMRARARWIYLVRLGTVLDARGSPEAAAHWQETGTALEEWRSRFGVGAKEVVPFVDALLRLARHCFDAAPDQRTLAVLDQVGSLSEEHGSRLTTLLQSAAEACRWRALLAARRGDLDQAAEASERALTFGTGWQETLAAARGMHAAWRAARSRQGLPPGRVSDLRARASELHQDAVDMLRQHAAAAPEAPGLVVPLRLAEVRLAELLLDGGERAPAQELLAAALPALAALRDQVHADLWDEELYRLGETLAVR